MTVLDRKKQARDVVRILKKRYPDAHCSLDHRNALELLVATVLSAQCTDACVNKVTPALFAKYRTARDYARVPVHELETDIRSTGFYRNKAKNIKAACTIIDGKFSGRVPDSMEDLLTLPGVARKTANVVLGVAFAKAEGVVVDTHVGRITKLLGLTKNTDPKRIEQDLMACLPREDWIVFSHLLILHGRETCIARRPKCGVCPLNKICPYGMKQIAQMK